MFLPRLFKSELSGIACTLHPFVSHIITRWRLFSSHLNLGNIGQTGKGMRIHLVVVIAERHVSMVMYQYPCIAAGQLDVITTRHSSLCFTR